MNKAQREASAEDLQRIHRWAESLAESFDPKRTGTAKDEAERAVVKACDVIATKASEALSMLRVSA